MPIQDISRQTSNVLLPTEISGEIWGKTIEQSAFMQVANRITIPGTGTKIQTVTGEPTAEWVDETGAKPVSFHAFGNKTVTPYKMAVIEPFSEEFRRDKKALYDECVRRLPGSLSKLFDATIMGAVAPGSGFDVLGTGVTRMAITPDATQGAEKSVYQRFIDIDAAVSAADGIMNGIVLSPQGKSIVLGATDTIGHPLFTAGVGSNTVGNILGSSVAVAKGVYKAGSAASGSGSSAVAAVPAVVGVAGDFTGVRWGSVEGIKMAISDQATLAYTDSDSQTVTLNLWQRNMFAVRFEIELAFAVMDKAQLFLLEGYAPSE